MAAEGVQPSRAEAIAALRDHPVPRNAVWLGLERAVSLSVGLAANVVVARFLGPERFGLLSYAIALVGLLGILRHWGVSGIVQRDLVRAPNHRNELLGTMFALKVLGGVAALVAAAVLARYVVRDPVARPLVVIVALVFLFDSFSGIVLWYQSRLEARYSAIAVSAGVFSSAAFAVVFVLARLSVTWFAIVEVAQSAATAIALIVLYTHHGYRIRDWRPRAAQAADLLRQGWPLIVSSSVAIVYLKIDQVMLASLTTAAEVGRYGVASRLSEAWYFLPAILATSLFPSIIRSQQLPSAAYDAKLLRMYRIAVGLGLVVSVPTTLLAVPVIDLLYGADYHGAGIMLAVHIWACPAVFMGNILSRWIIAEGYQTFSITRHLLGAAVNVGLNLLLIPQYGGVGAAIATVISYTVANYFACFMDPRTRIAGQMMSHALVTPLAAFRSHHLTA